MTTIVTPEWLYNKTLQENYNQLLQCIQNYDTIIIHRHINPDPDALGSQLGLAQLIKDNFATKRVYCVGEDLPSLTWIGYMDIIDDTVYTNALVIVIDTANSPRIDDERYTLGQCIFKVDHHPIVEQYGTYNLVDTTASSASEMVAQFAFSQQLTVTLNAAQYIYTGICGDTGRFLYTNTSAKTMAIVAQLRQLPFDFFAIHNAMQTKSLQEARLCGYVLQHITVENHVAHVIVSKELLEQFELDVQSTGSVVGLPGTIDGVISWVIFIEQPNGHYRARLRSKGPVINGIAQLFDGGGHPLASGANAYSLADIDRMMQLVQNAVFVYKEEQNDKN